VLPERPARLSRPAILEVGFAVESRRERTIVQGAGLRVLSLVRRHSLYTVFGLIRWQFSPQLVSQNVWLVTGENTEAIDDLFGGVGVGGFACHKVEEGVEVNVSGAVGIDDRENTLEVDVALSILADRVSQRNETRLELVRC